MTASNATKHALETKVEAAKKKRDTARQEVDQHDVSQPDQSPAYRAGAKRRK